MSRSQQKCGKVAGTDCKSNSECAGEKCILIKKRMQCYEVPPEHVDYDDDYGDFGNLNSFRRGKNMNGYDRIFNTADENINNINTNKGGGGGWSGSDPGPLPNSEAVEEGQREGEGSSSNGGKEGEGRGSSDRKPMGIGMGGMRGRGMSRYIPPGNDESNNEGEVDNGLAGNGSNSGAGIHGGPKGRYMPPPARPSRDNVIISSNADDAKSNTGGAVAERKRGTEPPESDDSDDDDTNNGGSSFKIRNHYYFIVMILTVGLLPIFLI